MNLQQYKEKKFEKIISSMVEYMNLEGESDEDLGDCGYTQDEIDACVKILDDYIDELIELGDNSSEDAIMASVKKVVLALNELNERADYSLIETDQREYLCPFIQDAAINAGLPLTPVDITEEWRMW